MSVTVSPRVYVACLAAYNSGQLHGAWIDVEGKDGDDIRQDVANMLASSPQPNAEEWAIHDYEGFGPIKLSESASFDDVAQLAELIERHGELFAEVYEKLADGNVNRAIEYIDEHYQGQFCSIAEYAESFCKDCYGEVLNKLPSFLQSAIDYESVAKDFELGGDVVTLEHDSMIHVFDGNF